jgi:uncharacterized protein YndB with AHSA1/START domain
MARTHIMAEPGVPQILVSREFDASPELLFRAHTEPNLLVQWLAPPWSTMTIDRLDLRNSGIWRYVHWDADDNPYAFRGVFHGTPSPDGIVQTCEFEGMPGHVWLETTTFTEHGGKTLLSRNTVFQTVVDRDRRLDSGLADAADASLDQLDDLLARLVPVSPRQVQLGGL